MGKTGEGGGNSGLIVLKKNSSPSQQHAGLYISVTCEIPFRTDLMSKE